jgi:hypothetical protein
MRINATVTITFPSHEHTEQVILQGQDIDAILVAARRALSDASLNGALYGSVQSNGGAVWGFTIEADWTQAAQ